MKYIRTKDGKIVELKPHRFYKYVLKGKSLYLSGKGEYLYINNVVSQANTIDELCDEFVAKDEKSCLGNYIFSIYEMGDKKYVYINEESGEPLLKDFIKNKEVYGAIWTDKGLIYVAKMNDKGELELL